MDRYSVTLVRSSTESLSGPLSGSAAAPVRAPAFPISPPPRSSQCGARCSTAHWLQTWATPGMIMTETCLEKYIYHPKYTQRALWFTTVLSYRFTTVPLWLAAFGGHGEEVLKGRECSIPSRPEQSNTPVRCQRGAESSTQGAQPGPPAFPTVFHSILTFLSCDSMSGILTYIHMMLYFIS